MDFRKVQILGFSHFALAVAKGRVLGFSSPPGDWGIMDSRKVQIPLNLALCLGCRQRQSTGFLQSPGGPEDHGFRKVQILGFPLSLGCRQS